MHLNCGGLVLNSTGVYLLGLEAVEPLQSVKQFEEYQENPEAFLQKRAEKKKRDDLKLAAKVKATQQAPKAPLKEPTIMKNVLTRMERR